MVQLELYPNSIKSEPTVNHWDENYEFILFKRLCYSILTIICLFIMICVIIIIFWNDIQSWL